MVKSEESAFARFGPFCACVVGDLVLDHYTLGSVNRISPEAPVPVVLVNEEKKLPGMVGNVALNVQALGGTVSLLSRIGSDSEGLFLRSFFHAHGIEGTLFVQDGYETPIKHRIIANRQQIVRIDREKIVCASQNCVDALLYSAEQNLAFCDVLAISDYAKGLLTQELLSSLIAQARSKDIPIIVDPKGRDLRRYRGATCVKPNKKEAYFASGLPTTASLDDVASVLLFEHDIKALVITCSGDGIFLYTQGGVKQHFPVEMQEVVDVTGAGDTVLATLACGLANGLSLVESIPLANVAAQAAISQLGCVQVSLYDLAKGLLRARVSNKVFESEHLFALKAILARRSFSVLSISLSEGLTAGLFAAIAGLAAEKSDLLIFVKDAQEVHISMLTALSGVDFIIAKGENLAQLCRDLEPNALYIYTEHGLVAVDSVRSLLSSLPANALL